MLGIAQASRWGIGQHPGGGSRAEKQRGVSDKSLVIVGGAEGEGRWYVYLDALGDEGG
jgi:hypothetical protein